MDFLGLGTFFVGFEVANIFDKVTIWEHFRNLCEKVGTECTEHLDRAQAATHTRDWFVFCSEWTSCGDVIVRSGLLDRDDRIWLTGCHALVLANLWAFYRKDSGRALKNAIAASKARDEVQNVPEALDFKSYVEATLLKIMYLWASTSDCEEETLDPDVKAFLIDKLRYTEDLVSDYEVRTLKQQCKEFVINNSESVIWEIQKGFFDYFETEECLRWAREGSNLYQRRYPGMLDYVSKLNEALVLCVSGAFEKASEVLREIIINNFFSKSWKVKGRNPAACYCNPPYYYIIHRLQCHCYKQMAVQSGRGEKKTSELIKLANEEEAECQSLLAQSEYAEMFSSEHHRVRATFEYAAKNKHEVYEEGYENCSRDESKWVDFPLSTVLNELHADFRSKYRQSYERSTPDERYFSNAELCATEVLNNWYSLGRVGHTRIRAFIDLVRLHHEKDRQVMFLKQSSNFDAEEKAPILQCGEKVINCYVKNLLLHTEDDNYWLVAQELCNDLCYMMQFHYFAKWIAIHGCTLASTCDIKFTDRLQQLWNQSLMSEPTSAETAVSQELWKQSLVWAERGVGKSTYFQLAPNMSSTSAMQQLCEFNQSDDVAWNTLKSSRATCGPGTVVLEYFVSAGNDLQFVYVMTKDDEVFMQILKVNGLDSMLWKALEWLRNMCSLWAHECGGELINGILELLYEILISPVANFLDGMEQEDKLIIVAPEILSDVPFAALRKFDSPEGEGYLIQSHTLSVTPSLRTLQDCDHKWKELDKNFILSTNPGTIVAVAEPAYKYNGNETTVPIITPMGEEVNFIEQLFGEGYVKKLVGSAATPSEVLQWAKYPSEHQVKQVIFHIAAHGMRQDDRLEVKKGAIVLARNDTAGQGPRRIAQDDENCDNDNDNVHDETDLGDSFSMVDGKEAQISSDGEVGGIRTGFVRRTSTRDILNSENISGCGFPWKAHIVVLGACDTARGQITGEGVLNLPRALMMAGVPCVVVSQWKVPDSSTCELMKGFYKELRSGKDVSSSLRAAMLEMIKEGAKVREWAPFFVCGLPTVCIPKELQGGTSSCNVHDHGTASDTKAALRGKDVKVKSLDLTDCRIERFFNPGKSGACLECNMEWRIVLEDHDDVKLLKKLLARSVEIKEKRDWTYKDVEELDKLLVQANSISEKHMRMDGKKLDELMAKMDKIREKEMTDEGVEELRKLKAMGDSIVANLLAMRDSISAKHLRMEGK